MPHATITDAPPAVGAAARWPLRSLLRATAIALVAGVLAVLVVRGLASDRTQFLTIVLNGFSLAALYFLVASGLTLIFGLLRVVNLAHGAFYLLGGYLGYSVATHTGNWYLAVAAAAAGMAVFGALVQVLILRRIQGEDLREALITIGLSIIVADQVLSIWGGAPVDIDIPSSLDGSTSLGVANIVYPTFRLFVMATAIVIGIGLYALLKHTRLGLLIRAGVDDRHMVAALGVNIQVVFTVVFALGAALAGLSGAMGGSYLSLSPGEDGRFLLFSLVVVIVGGMGSIGGAAIGALLVGITDQFAAVYVPTYSILLTFAVLVAVLSLRPYGLLGRQS